MRPYSMDLRERVLADCDAGLETRAVATKYRVSESWVRRLKQRRRDRGEVAPRVARRGPSVLRTEHDARLRELVAAHPDATLRELREGLGVAVCLATLWNALRRLGVSLKKKSCGLPSKTGRTSRRSAGTGVRSKATGIRSG